jgi:hypothetical protein
LNPKSKTPIAGVISSPIFRRTGRNPSEIVFGRSAISLPLPFVVLLFARRRRQQQLGTKSFLVVVFI